MGESAPINDFILVIGNNMDEELETFRLFNIMSDPKVKNHRVLFQLQARDLPVRRRGGWYFFNLLLGRRPIIGKYELAKMREMSVAEDLVFQIKSGKPNIYVVFAESLENMPKAFKDDVRMRTFLQMFFLMRQNEESLAELYASANLQQTEIQDRLSQSQTMVSKFVTEQMQQYAESMQQTERKNLDDMTKQPQQGQQQKGFY